MMLIPLPALTPTTALTMMRAGMGKVGEAAEAAEAGEAMSWATVLYRPGVCGPGHHESGRRCHGARSADI